MKVSKQIYSISLIPMEATYHSISNRLQYNRGLTLGYICDASDNLADTLEITNELEYLYGNRFILSKLKCKTKYSLNRLINKRREHTRTLKS